MARQNPKETGNAEEVPDDEEVVEASAGTIPKSSSDICKALAHRYAKSKAPQHRHLIATATAMRSILLEEGLPLIPPAYFAAAITTLRDSDHSDVESIGAISSLLSILLSIDSMVLPPPKAKDAAFFLADVLKLGCTSLPTGTVRSLIKSLGMLVFLLDLDDWTALKLPLQTLLMYAVDKRPKVRKCAHECIEKVFKTLPSPRVLRKASKAVFSMYSKYMPLSEQVVSTELSDPDLCKFRAEFQHSEVLHMLNVLTVLVPQLSEKVRMKIMSSVYKLLGCSFSSYTVSILRLLEELMEHIKVEHLVSQSEAVFSALISYVSTDNNPMDTLISASILFKNGLRKLRDVKPSLWIKCLPPVITSLAGYLSSGADTSKHVVALSKELINTHINREYLLITTSPLCSCETETPEAVATVSICTVFDNLLGACDMPAENLLAVISVLFLTLGEYSYFFMKEIFLKLSQKTVDLKEDPPNTKHLEACIGTAIIGMGPEKVLSLVPLSFDMEQGTCTNTWMLPILKKYVTGASLQYFVEHIVPIAESVQNACKKVKKPSKLKRLQTYFHGLWDLLPAFCRCPTDTPESFGALSKLLVATLEESPSLHETIANSVQELVNGNRRSIKTNQGAQPCADLPSSFILSECEVRSLHFCYPEKTASRNIEALACDAMGLFHILADIFLDSATEKQASLKEAIGCLAFVLGSENIKHFFVSMLEKLESGQEDDEIEGDAKGCIERTSESKNRRCSARCSLIVLASSFVETADEELTITIFNFIKSSLLNSDDASQCEAYFTLSKILEVNILFCQTRIVEVMDLLFSVKISVDGMTIENRFSCLHYVLAHILKRNDEDLNTKAFLILNEIITTLKTKNESRKLAYDILLNISHTLKNAESNDKESGYQRLLNMVMGYLSSSSPHIMSGAISALSLLIHSDARICTVVPNLIPSVLILLQNKSIEVIKAALGFIKVMVCSLHSSDLMKVLTDVLDGILPWSSVSKHHCRLKVGIILEILIRKCGIDAVALLVSEKHKGFVKAIQEGRQKKKNHGLSNSETTPGSAGFLKNKGQKRELEDPSDNHLKSTHRSIYKVKRRKQQNDIASTNKTSGRGGGSQSLTPAVTSMVGGSFKLQSHGICYKRKRSVFEKPNRRNKMHASPASEYGVSSNASKNRKSSRGPRNQVPK